ncbi:MAG: 50S ribosomal protein L9 [Paludibacteraceae bacterium]|jgi:large subunit ribosomal protein L9|nr:50S ribosomal protein L9 [Paludibacteraceae bacterium]MCR5298424.1 50S ribosomal protein L9 [Paludibacteraceae bacterium]
MQVILKEDIQNLGYKDDIVKVKDGYGRNYLIPQKKAIVATPSAVKSLQEELKQRAKKLAKIKAEAEELAAKINGISVQVAIKASENGKIFGSVTPLQVAEALAKQGIEVDRKILNIPSIKELGQFKAVAKLHKEVSAEFDLNVVAEA